MDKTKFDSIVAKVKQKEQAIARAEGSMASIMDGLAKYGISTIEQAQAKLAELKKEGASLVEQQDKLYKELEG